MIVIVRAELVLARAGAADWTVVSATGLYQLSGVRC